MRTPDQVARGYDQAAARYDELHGTPRLVARARVIEQPFRSLAGRILELGCGTGRLLGALPGPAVGVDVSAGMLARGRARARGLAVARADAHALPFADGHFDAVVAGKGVFRYLELEPALAECARLLRPGGLLGVHQYSARTWSLRGRRPPEPMHLREPAELVEPAARRGFRLLAEQRWRPVSRPPWLLPVPSRLPGAWWGQIVLIFRKIPRT